MVTCTPKKVLKCRTKERLNITNKSFTFGTSSSAIPFLGRMYEDGKGREKESFAMMAKDSYELAVQQEHVHAMINLGAIYTQTEK